MQFLEPSLDLVDRFQRRVLQWRQHLDGATLTVLDNSLATFLSSARFFGCRTTEIQIAGAHRLLLERANDTSALSQAEQTSLLNAGDAVRAMYRRLRDAGGESAFGAGKTAEEDQGQLPMQSPAPAADSRSDGRRAGTMPERDVTTARVRGEAPAYGERA